MAHVFELSFCALVREDFGVHNHVRRVHIKLSDVSPLSCATSSEVPATDTMSR